MLNYIISVDVPDMFHNMSYANRVDAAAAPGAHRYGRAAISCRQPPGRSL
jgi:hypothetical protein